MAGQLRPRNKRAASVALGEVSRFPGGCQGKKVGFSHAKAQRRKEEGRKEDGRKENNQGFDRKKALAKPCGVCSNIGLLGPVVAILPWLILKCWPSKFWNQPLMSAWRIFQRPPYFRLAGNFKALAKQGYCRFGFARGVHLRPPSRAGPAKATARRRGKNRIELLAAELRFQ